MRTLVKIVRINFVSTLEINQTMQPSREGLLKEKMNLGKKSDSCCFNLSCAILIPELHETQ